MFEMCLTIEKTPLNLNQHKMDSQQPQFTEQQLDLLITEILTLIHFLETLPNEDADAIN